MGLRMATNKMQKFSKIFIKITIALTLMFAVFSFAYALDDYTVLTPLPGTTSCPDGSTPTAVTINQTTGKVEGGCQTTFQKYLPAFFNLTIGIAAVLAFIMITWGGIEYMTTDAIFGKSSGKERITNAIWGLLLVIASWVILNTINPNLLNFSLILETPKTQGQSAADLAVILGGDLSAGTGKILPGYTLTDAQVKTNTAMINDLKNNYGINVNAGPCTNGETSGCTDLVGMPASTYDGLKALRTACGAICGIMISGGTEGGHASHGPNQPPIDLRPDFNPIGLDGYILAHQISAPQVIPGVGTVYTVKVGDINSTFLREGDHWHVVFGTKP